MMVLAVLSTNTVASYDFFNAILIWYVVTSAVLILHVPSFLRIVRTSPTNVRTSHDFFSRASQGAFAETKVPRAGDPGHVPVSSRRQGPLSVQSSVLSANSTPLEANAGGGWRGSISSAPGAVDNFAAAVGEVGSRYAIFEVDILPSRFLWFLASWKRAEIWIIETKEHTLLQFFDVDQQKDQLCYGGALKSFELDLSQLIEGKRQGVTAILRGKTQDRQFQVKFSHVDQLDMFARHFGKERGT
ncbi:hypothetical protein BC828DRAFT_373578 [Blastocladiella britannica]|nr:hypothetical protein BC828DRAFT_373578 [Blastocladiella britannica]